MTTLIRGLKNLPSDWSDCAVTIGKYDGLHLGHQHIVSTLKQKAKGLPVVVISFYPNPLQYFAKDTEFCALQTLRDKLDVLQQWGVDYFLLLPFNQQTQRQTADLFLRDLRDVMRARVIAVGEDFHFGYKRQGDIAMLRAFGEQEQINVVTPALQTIDLDGDQQIIGSSLVRELLGAGDLAAVQQVLGRPYRISGHVVKGDQVGRQLGFPTANIHLKNMRPALRGVFAVKVYRQGEFVANGVANLGTRPTVSGLQLLLEVHLFVETIDCYGQCLSVDFVSKIRDEKKFASVQDLQAQIARDVESAKRLFD